MTSRREECVNFRQTLVRLVSLMHASALNDIHTEGTVRYELYDVNGLDDTTLTHLRKVQDERLYN
eukprot:CAMPEP_0170319922 /NCGR_PEP_ID=MMETSP0116_2-20130129/60681_1 /TAXON_ID=400756 /ORGANISM="Durinskia baltica, Strain CSIRO CS-38" /LENGTH=64 /DNA_ID=CAMNT_0010572665 /DNA_START=40 /DNA_END=231 /DNA_ORIENTATION=+